MMRSAYLSWQRLRALCRKEIYQILRDPASGIIAFVIPCILLFIFGYGVNLDPNRLRLGILLEQQSEEAHQLAQTFMGSPYVEPVINNNRRALIAMLQSGSIRGLVIIPVDFSQKILRQTDQAPIQVITDGSEPNTANFVQAYALGVWQHWMQRRISDQGRLAETTIELQPRYWFNAAAVSQHFIIPGAITIIMTVIGAILTSLVIAREWERGTMEVLLATQITRTELLLSKLLPYFVLGMIAMALCMIISIFIMHIPYRGSWWVLLIMSSLFLISTLGMGLLISTLTRNQFNAAMIALNTAFLPAIMLSGFIFEIASMPAIVIAVTYIVPARYFVSTLQTLFLAGDIGRVFVVNGIFLFVSGLALIGLTALKTRKYLD